MVDLWEDGAIIVGGKVSVTTMDHSFNWIFFLKDWIRSHSFGSSRTKTRSSSTIFQGLCCVVLCCCGLDRRWCCVVVAQIGGGFLLL